MKIIKIVWNILVKLKFLIIVSILALSLLINGTLFMGGKLLSVVTGGFETVTGMQTLSSKNKSKISKLDDNLLVERKIKRELKTELAETSGQLIIEKKAKRGLKNELAKRTLELTTERIAKEKLKKQLKDKAGELTLERIEKRLTKRKLRDLAKGLVIFKGKKVALSAAVNETANTIGKRSLKSAKRNIASMPGEAIPWVGTSVIVGVTAYEIYDLCETIKDMNELKKAFNPSDSSSDEELTVCSLEVPSKEDILSAVKNSPSAAWEKAKNVTPTLEEIKATEMPDFSSWWDEKQKNTSDLTDKINKWWKNE
jgi:hypothetical protein